MKIGTEDKKKLTILAVAGTGALGCAFYIYNALSVPNVPAPAAAPVATVPVVSRNRPQAVSSQAPLTQLDPTLKMGPMLVTEALVYSGGGRNIFSATSVPVEIPKAIAPARPKVVAPVYVAPAGPPPPPPIDLKFFGTATSKNGARQAFLLHVADRGLLISTSPFEFGMTYPYAFGDPAAGEYQALEIGAEFKSLASVPSIFKHHHGEDCSSYPARRGFSDLLQLANISDNNTPAWTVAVNTTCGFLWFALKDVSILPTTIVWMENHGRYGVPWNGRNCALGLEDACTYFDRGIGESSRKNIFSERGIKTHHILGGASIEVRFIQGVVKTPPGFGRVVDAEFTDDSVCFMDATGKRVASAVQRGYLSGARLK